jgi:hypothetical protein
LKHFVHQNDDPLCRLFFFSPTAFLMSRSQTNVWASYSRPFLRPRTCTSIRTTVLRLKTCDGVSWLAATSSWLGLQLLQFSQFRRSSLFRLFIFSVVGSRELEAVTCVIHPLRIVWTWKVKSSVAIIKHRPDLIMTRFGLNLLTVPATL